MSNNKLFRIKIFVIILILIVSSCRKNAETNFDVNKLFENNETVKNKFLDTSNIDNKSVLNVISDIKKLDSNYNFIKNFVVNNGNPNWKKVISNELFINHIKIQNLGSDPNAQNQEIPRKVFLIPFTKESDTISGILACVNEKENFTYKFYDRKKLEILYNSNDTIKKSRENIFAIFAFFENFINQRNSTSVDGIYSEIFSNVNIDFKNTAQNNNTSNSIYQINSGLQEFHI